MLELTEEKKKPETNLKEEILDEVQKRLKGDFQALKTDLLADIKELVAKTHQPQTEQMPKEISGILSSLAGGGNANNDQAIQTLMNMATSNTKSEPIPNDIPKEEYLKARREDKIFNLISVALPLIFAKNPNQMGGAWGELLQRSFLDNIYEATLQRKTISNLMMRNLGGEIMKNLGPMAPVVQAAEQMGNTPIGTPPPAAGQAPI